MINLGKGELDDGHIKDITLRRTVIKEQATKQTLCRDYRNLSDKKKNDPAVDVRLLKWADSSITLRAYIWTDTQEDGFLLRTDLFYAVKKEFETHKIEIPFPHRTIVYKQNEPKKEE